MYDIVKHFHLTTIVLSVVLLLLRFVLNTMHSPILQKKWLKILPHIVDTLLLVSAGTLCILVKQYPFVDAWVIGSFLVVVIVVFTIGLIMTITRRIG